MPGHPQRSTQYTKVVNTLPSWHALCDCLRLIQSYYLQDISNHEQARDLSMPSETGVTHVTRELETSLRYFGQDHVCQSPCKIVFVHYANYIF